ncbi:MAG: glucose-6-phosphate isomerase [Spirochaetota bacterium]
MIQYKNLDTSPSFRALSSMELRLNLNKTLSRERIEACEIKIGAGLTFNYASCPVDDSIIALLQKLSDEQQLVEKYRAMVNGEIMNTSENRMVLHHLARGQLLNNVMSEGKNLRTFYSDQQSRIQSFCHKVHAGSIKGSTGKSFTTVVQIGIGGSDLGPRALYLGLKNYVASEYGSQKMKAYFISNVDPDDPNEIVSEVDVERTLFILVSKSGTTQETLTNRQFVLEKIKRLNIPGMKPERHMIVVTSESSPLAASSDYLDSFYIDDFIGGRYSSTSAVGGVVLSLAFSPEIFKRMLNGAHEGDKNGLDFEIRKNGALMDALIGIYERNILRYPVTAILPYSQALCRFPAHLQQLDMESNGKSVNRFGQKIEYSTGPVVFGEPGTNGQHSFYQLLHQGSEVIPLQFIGFKKPQIGFDISTDGSSSQQKLNANLAAQIVAFALGKKDKDPNKDFAGNRPSSLIHGDRLTPEALGALLSHFENKVMFQGFAWNINSFDQEGVQLGKSLTKQILAGVDNDPVLLSYARLLDVKS